MQASSSVAFQPLVRRVVLRTRDARRLAAFYQQAVGLVSEPDRQAANTTSLVHPRTGEVLISLVENRSARLAPAGAPGLFHIAFLYPDLNDWTTAVSRARPAASAWSGAADHGVSWAVYFSDPDGNGIELAWDKPDAEWPWHGDRIQMTSLALPLNSILASIPTTPSKVGTFHIGHLHLQVANLAIASSYADHLGLRVTQTDYPGAVFMARGAYHHHFAINHWRVHPHAVRLDQDTGLIGWEWTHANGDTAMVEFDHAKK